MPVTWSVDPNGVAVVVHTAPYTWDQWQRAMDEILAALETPRLRLLSDRRGVDPPDTELVDHIVGYLRAHAGELSGSVVAIVVNGDAAFGMARMLAIRTEVARVPMAMKIFLNYEDAVRWVTSADPADASG